ncbi:FAD-dependent oxidoreductase [Actinoplanes sp. Pm04-4]|uniref:D-amino-acid oxidase n=1 Tax=Paractinoplanes pyxinae TaxID=2997416 RepID=A0ABT4BG65_9ACTN|nr:FAD-dependent oxidoreductase [Actinoplanes pyxinae]MCY1144553.1 FAD-dependent oxidoreductase [Actinoplanes pyxinae]
MVSTRADVLVVGAGVIGLTTALRLARRGLDVMIWTSRETTETCSFAAGAIFDPYMAEHRQRDEWAAATRREFERLHDEGHAWARQLHGVEASRVPASAPAWALDLPDYRECGLGELPPGFVSGWRYRSLLIEMPPYLAWLGHQLRDHGVDTRIRTVESLRAGFAEADIVVNCTGIGAHRLDPGETQMQPIRGQLVVLPNPGIGEFFVEHVPDPYLGETTYVLPQGDRLLLGGSAEKGVSAGQPDPEVSRRILERCRAVLPQLAGIRPIGERVGIRPHRATVRLEHEDFGDHHVVHNYGHGGSGVSLSWGCADAVAEIVADIIEKSRPAALGDDVRADATAPARTLM